MTDDNGRLVVPAAAYRAVEKAIQRHDQQIAKIQAKRAKLEATLAKMEPDDA